MNILIAAIVGSVLSVAAVVGGVSAAEPQVKPIATADLYTYATP